MTFLRVLQLYELSNCSTEHSVTIWKILKLSQAVQSVVGIFHISYALYQKAGFLAAFLMAFFSFGLQMWNFRPNFLFSVGEKLCDCAFVEKPRSSLWYRSLSREDKCSPIYSLTQERRPFRRGQLYLIPAFIFLAKIVNMLKNRDSWCEVISLLMWITAFPQIRDDLFCFCTDLSSLRRSFKQTVCWMSRRVVYLTGIAVQESRMSTHTQTHTHTHTLLTWEGRQSV